MKLTPMETEIQLLRFSWTQALCGETENQLTLTGSLLGNDQTQFELSSYWTNVSYFEVPLPCSSYYRARLQSRNAAGTSNTFVPLNGTTGTANSTQVLLMCVGKYTKSLKLELIVGGEGG